MHCFRVRVGWFLTLLAGTLLVCGGGSPPANAATPEQFDFFESKIRPLLAQNCYVCHSASAQPRFANLHLDSREGMLRGGDRGPALVPGDPDGSRLIQAVRREELKMPPTEPLAPRQIAALARWVEMGAPWPEDPEGKQAGGDPVEGSSERLKHWAWQPVTPAPAPEKAEAAAAQSTTDATDAIDRLVRARLEAAGLTGAGEADRYTLLRRVTFDLTGLPPTTEQIEAFVNDDSAGAFEKVIDRLLDSPGFGERWGRHWLDLTGYADSLGLGRRIPAQQAWRYRDYVIDAFNFDKPYEQFIREQVAGDMLDWETDAQRREQLIATGFLAIGPFALVDADKVQLRMDVIDNQIDTVGRVVLGLTLGCARCHDHKFDPVSNREYYALAGIFRSTKTLHGRLSGVFSGVNVRPLPETPDELRRRADELERFPEKLEQVKAEAAALQQEKDRLDELKKQRQEGAGQEGSEQSAESELKAGAEDSAADELTEKIKEVAKKLRRANNHVKLLEFTKPGVPAAIALEDRDVPVNSPIHIQGNPHVTGVEVPRGFLAVATKTPPEPFANRRDFRGSYVKSSGRLELAQWLTEPSNPLTARVMVNRIWGHLFGAGLVHSVDNFGLRGEKPSHPRLLDLLAARFVERGWSIKKTVREIVLSRTYRQAATHDAQAHQVDPENRLLWRANRRRLEAEAFRDALLLISGKLDPGRGGPSLPLHSPDDVNIDFPSFLVPKAKLGEDVLYRRTVYLPVVRKSQLDQLDILNLFDFPDPNQITGARAVTTVPTQSLYMMNAPFPRSQARVTAEVLLADKKVGDRERIERFTFQALNRPATATEIDRALTFLAEFEKESSRSDEPPESPRLEAWTRYCHAVFVSNEFLFRG